VRSHQRQLADSRGLEPMYVSKRVGSRAGVRLLTPTPHPADPRAIELSLTRRGGQCGVRGTSHRRQALRAATRTLGGAARERAAQLNASLQLSLRDADDARRQAASTPAQRAFRKETQP
jgi:MarR family transcriptional regulator, organic hydroperoxide resistance regulator